MAVLVSFAVFALGQILPHGPGNFVIHTASSQAAVVITGDDKAIDFAQANLLGTLSLDQEKYSGVGLELDHCRNVTVSHLKVRGYRINVLLKDCVNVRLSDVDASNSRAMRIVTESGEPIDAFLNLRDIKAWRGYGAGFWLQGCLSCRLAQCRGEEAMIGAVLEGSKDCTVYDNEFAYNSAWGVALWGSDACRISWNHLDFCNRPWAGGWGGDAAAMALVNGSSDNLIVANSMTHGGDGFFLAAVGDSGDGEKRDAASIEGSCNRNIVWRNDGSWSPNNAFESTFSLENLFGENLADDSGYGFWLGYSADNLVAGNQIERELHDGVAIEHGVRNRIEANRIEQTHGLGIHLWTQPNAPTSEQPSSDNLVAFNRIEGCKAALNFDRSIDTTTYGNVVKHSPIDPSAVQADAPTKPSDVQWSTPPEVTPLLRDRPPGWLLYRDMNRPKGFEWIRPGLYAPLLNRTIATTKQDSYTYHVWTLGVSTDIRAPDWVQIDHAADKHYWTVRSASDDPVGETKRATVTFDGIMPNGSVMAGTLHLPFRTGAWDCRWFAWKGVSYDDRPGWLRIFDSTPLATQRLPDLNADWSYRSPVPGTVPIDHFALLATRKYKFEGGTYTFFTNSDDGVRLFLDGREIISRWSHHGATADRKMAKVSQGIHELRVEYCQEDGAAVLQVDWARNAAAH